jgi:hypothetical protein
MKVAVHGQGIVSLDQADFVGQGGQGSVYAKGPVAFKIFSDVGAMIPLGKIRELGRIADPQVIKPDALVLDDKSGKAIGYTMRYVPDAIPLCQLFPPAFRQRHGIDGDTTLALVMRLAERVWSVHRGDALIVDLNEMNFLVAKSFDEVLAIDADSYQTPSYRASAISPLIRDPYSAHDDFSQLSDWFSFAVVSFQMFVGVHPYRGKHATVKSVSERMRKHLSALDPHVSLPPAVLPLDVIPQAFRDWYRAVLQEGKRLAPPRDPVATHALAVAGEMASSTPELLVEPLLQLAGPIRTLFGDRGGAAVCDDGVFALSGRRLATHAPALGDRVGIVFTPRQERPIFAELGASGLALHDLVAGVGIETPMRADELCIAGGRLLIKSGDAIVELCPREIGDATIVTPKLVARVLPKASRLFDGVVVQSLLGASYLTLLGRSTGCRQLRVPELDGMTVLEAKNDGNVVVAMVADSGRYHRLILRADPHRDRYDLRWARDVDPGAVDLVALDSGVCICRGDHGRLEVFSDKVGSADLRWFDTGGALGGARLARAGNRVLAFGDRMVYRLATRLPRAAAVAS